ncbi:MAG: hypothetical protein ABL955_15690, partial [Elusimicrobiota bacterium]
MTLPISGTRLASYGLFVLALIAIARFGLAPCVLAGLVSYMILDVTERRLIKRGTGPRLAKWTALAVFAILASALSWIFIAFVRVGVSRLPVLIDTVLPRLTTLSANFGFELPVDNALELRDLAVTEIRDNFSSVSK